MYLIPEWVTFYWVLCSQRDTTQQNEEQNKIGEDVVVDNPMTQNSKPKKVKKKVSVLTDSFSRGENFTVQMMDKWVSYFLAWQSYTFLLVQNHMGI